MENKPAQPLPSKPNILIVDDDPHVLELLTCFLSSSQEFRVYQANNAFAALGIIASAPIDVVVTDIVIPGMDGLTLMRKASAKAPQIRWIILSGEGTLDRAIEAIRLGAVDFLCKPLFGMNDLVAAVRRALRQTSPKPVLGVGGP